MPERFHIYLKRAESELLGLHRRYWANAADIMLGAHYYLTFCRTENVLEQVKYERLLRESWEAIVGLLKVQNTLIQRYSKDGVVGRAFCHLLRNGKFHLLQAGTEGRPADVPADRVGWVDGPPQGAFLGFANADKKLVYVPTGIDTQQLYDELSLEAQRVLNRGPKLFWKRLGEQNLLAATETGRIATKVPD